MLVSSLIPLAFTRNLVLFCFLALSPLDEYREHVRQVLRSDSLPLVLGLLIGLFGLSAAWLFFLRKRKERALGWFALLALPYSARLLLDVDSVRFALGIPDEVANSARMVITYGISIPGALFAWEIFLPWRRALKPVIVFSIVFACIGIVADILTGRAGALHTLNNVIVLATWVSFGFALFRYGSSIPHLLELQTGLVVFGATVILVNLRNLGMPGLPFDLEPLGFAFFLLVLGRLLVMRLLAKESQLNALTTELEIATRIQLAILPRDLPATGGLQIAAKYMPMTSVAGDFYDFLVVDHSRVGVLIADVSGHGVPAALIASMVKVAIAAQLPHAGDPGRVLTGMNQTLCGKMQGQFVSAAYLFLDRSAGYFRYAGAGHPPLLWHSAKGNHVERLEENGLLLGVFPSAPYTFTEQTMGPGDRFLLYTDGLMEAADEKDEFFGEERVSEALAEARDLPPDTFARELLDRLATFAGHHRGRTQEDDLTVIVVDIGSH